MISLCLHLVQLFLVSTVVTANEVENNLKCYGLNCGFNPDDFLNVPQIIRRHGYPSESHIVTTLDGYLLTVFRIPGSRSGKKGGPPVLLQHGLSGDSAPWVICDNNSLGKICSYSLLFKLILCVPLLEVFMFITYKYINKIQDGNILEAKFSASMKLNLL